MKGKKLFGLALTTVALSLTACGKQPEPQPGPGGDDKPKVEPLPAGTDTGDITKDAVVRENFESVYEKIGSKVTIDMVEEDAKGLAFATVEGKKYELGMDFLSMAMVYNTKTPSNSAKYKNAEDVYNQWWKLYIQRWNSLMPEIPLYSNQYFDMYANKLDNFRTSPYWGAADALNATTSTDGNVILGNSTALGGSFRSSSWGKSSPAASDLDIENLTSGYSTVMTDFEGVFHWNLWDADQGYGALAQEPTATLNQDGTLTYTIEIHPGLRFSDGSEIKAANYIVGLLANSTPVAKEAKGTGTSGQTLVGYKNFFNGAETGTSFAGVKLLDEYTFSVTYTADYADYYYVMTLAGFGPSPLKLYLGSATDALKVKEDKTVYLDSSFFAKDGEGKYTVAKEMYDNLFDIDKDHIPYSGPFYVDNYDKAANVATLKRNTYYPGDAFRGKTPASQAINNISYIKIEAETQISKFKAGEVNILSSITGGTETEEALAIVRASQAKETHYDRAGYGKLGFRADFGPTGFASVRRAIAYSINRPQFANTFTGGYGKVVDGPYYEGFSAYKAVKNEIKLNSYVASTASAIKELEADGWLYDKDGNPYNGTGVRYRKLSGYEKTVANLSFKSLDGTLKTEFSNGNWLMPLVINWFGTQPNDVTDLLITDWQQLKTANEDIGMKVIYQSTDFITGLYGELFMIPDYGFDGTQKLNAINFASGFTSTAYDYSWNWTIDPDLYEDLSACYVMDEADFFANY